MSKAEFLAKHLDKIPKADGTGIVKLVNFQHDSPGLRQLRKDIAEGLLALLDRYDNEGGDDEVAG